MPTKWPLNFINNSVGTLLCFNAEGPDSFFGTRWCALRDQIFVLSRLVLARLSLNVKSPSRRGAQVLKLSFAYSLITPMAGCTTRQSAPKSNIKFLWLPFYIILHYLRFAEVNGIFLSSQKDKVKGKLLTQWLRWDKFVVLLRSSDGPNL